MQLWNGELKKAHAGAPDSRQKGGLRGRLYSLAFVFVDVFWGEMIVWKV